MQIEGEFCPKPEEKILVAVSGGIDSMVLLHLLQRTSFEIAVAHFDHLTRHGQSTKDASFVEEYCKTHNISYFQKRFNTSKEVNNFQENARIQRNEFFTSLNYKVIATAHHFDDNIETILLNIFRGRSLRGIAPRNSSIIRPLYSFTKKEIEHYATQHNVSFVMDASNHENNYDRNFIRNDIFPKLADRFENFSVKLENLSQRNNDLLKLTQQAAKLILKPILHRDYISIPRIAFSPDIISDLGLLLFQYLQQFNFNLDQCQSIISNSESVGNCYESSTHRLVVNRFEFRVHELSKSLEFQNDHLNINLDLDQNKQQFTFGHFTFKFTIQKTWNIDGDSKTALIDYEKSGGELTLRYWREGDHFQPLNMNGQKQSLKKYFTNNKIERIAKHQIPILCCGEDVIWICGYRLDDRFKVTEKTKQIIRVDLS